MPKSLTSDKPVSAARARAESAFFWWRIIVTVVLLAWAAWQEIVRDGIREGARDFLGFGEIVERLSYIEETMPAPAVVEWSESASRQEGDCTKTDCLYRLIAARTAFGEGCGLPTEISISLRLSSGRIMRIAHKTWWLPIELGRSAEEFVFPLDIPETVAAGTYYWRARIIYPHCKGPNEPIPRYSPWFKLTVSK